MERVGVYRIGEKEYPLNFSVGASEKIAEQYGSIEGMAAAISKGGTVDQLKDAVSILNILMDEGAEREKIVNDVEIKKFTLDELKSVVNIRSIEEVTSAIMQSIGIGAETEVLVEEEKNELTTQSE